MVMAGSALVATIVAAAPKAHASQDPPKGLDPPPLPPHHDPPEPLPPFGHKPPTRGKRKS